MCHQRKFWQKVGRKILKTKSSVQIIYISSREQECTGKYWTSGLDVSNDQKLLMISFCSPRQRKIVLGYVSKKLHREWLIFFYTIMTFFVPNPIFFFEVVASLFEKKIKKKFFFSISRHFLKQLVYIFSDSRPMCKHSLTFLHERFSC